MDTFLDNQLIVPQYEFKVLTPDQPIMTKYSYSSKCSNDNTWQKGEKKCDDYSLGGYDCSDIGDDGRMAKNACLLSCDNCSDSVRIGKRLPSPVEDIKEPEWAVFEEYDSNGDISSIDGYLPDSPVGYRELLARIDEMEDNMDLIGASDSLTGDEVRDIIAAAAGVTVGSLDSLSAAQVLAVHDMINETDPGSLTEDQVRDFIDDVIATEPGEPGEPGSPAEPGETGWRAEVERLENLINELEGAPISAACPGYTSGTAANPSTTCPDICDLIPAVAAVEEVIGVAEVIGSGAVAEACTVPTTEEMAILMASGHAGPPPSASTCSTFTGGAATCPSGCQYTAPVPAVPAEDPVPAVSATQASAERCVPKPAAQVGENIVSAFPDLDGFIKDVAGVSLDCYNQLSSCKDSTTIETCKECVAEKTDLECVGEEASALNNYCLINFPNEYDCNNFRCPESSVRNEDVFISSGTEDKTKCCTCTDESQENYFFKYGLFIFIYILGAICFTMLIAAYDNKQDSNEWKIWAAVTVGLWLGPFSESGFEFLVGPHIGDQICYDSEETWSIVALVAAILIAIYYVFWGEKKEKRGRYAASGAVLAVVLGSLSALKNIFSRSDPISEDFHGR
jgi:hypothetical protein